MPRYLICVIKCMLLIFSLVTCRYSRKDGDVDNNVEVEETAKGFNSDLSHEDDTGTMSFINAARGNCWLTLNAKKHFRFMDNLDDRYLEIRKKYQKAAEKENFDKNMLDRIIATGAVADRELHKTGGNPNLIPAGLNLGGYCMMRMPESVLIFHRMKLRNDTRFRVNYLHHDLENMVLTARLSLNDLHLFGAYERLLTDKDPSVLFYTPTYGQVEFLLKNVFYKMEGRYRLVNDRLMIELVISDITVDNILTTYINSVLSKPSMRLEKKNIDEFLDRLKTDLDKWLRDYFNDYLLYFGLSGEVFEKFQKYNKEKEVLLNKYTDEALDAIKNRLDNIKSTAVRVPSFSIFAVHGMEIKLIDGVLRGLDSIYRRSVATAKKEKDVRNVDAIVGFSNLKMTYRYEIVRTAGDPPLTGLLILSADELTAHMGISLVEDTETVDLHFDFLEQMKAESITVEGPANRIISSLKHVLEHHIVAILSNTLIHNIKLLGTITKCSPQLFGYSEKEQKQSNEDNNDIQVESGSDIKAPSNLSDESDIGSVENSSAQKNPDVQHDNIDTSYASDPDIINLEKNDTDELEILQGRNGAEKKRLKLKYNEKLTVSKIK